VPVFLGFGDVQLAAPVATGTSQVRRYRGSLQSWLLQPSERLDTQGGGIIVERSHPWSSTVPAKLSVAREGDLNGAVGGVELVQWGRGAVGEEPTCPIMVALAGRKVGSFRSLMNLRDVADRHGDQVVIL